MFAFAALCAVVYLAAQTLQLVVTRAFAPAAGSPLDTLRATAILLSMFGVVPIHVAVALRRFRHAPGAAVCGVVFGALFVAFELAYRSIELLAPPIAGWSELVNAWYFPLLAVHLASSIAFTVACWPRAGDERWDALAAAAFGLNALRLAARLLGGYAGIAPLAAFSGPLYFPAMATVMSLLLVWLVRQAALARASLNGAAR